MTGPYINYFQNLFHAVMKPHEHTIKGHKGTLEELKTKWLIVEYACNDVIKKMEAENEMIMMHQGRAVAGVHFLVNGLHNVRCEVVSR